MIVKTLIGIGLVAVGYVIGYITAIYNRIKKIDIDFYKDF